MASDEVLETLVSIFFPADEESVVLLDSRTPEGDTPLHVVTFGNRVEAAQVLIAAGADVNAIGDMSETPLHVATRQGFVPIARALLVAGADPDKVSEFGRSSREYAALAGGELASLFDAQPPNNSFKPNPLRGSA